jgi:hypothetical protein
MDSEVAVVGLGVHAMKFVLIEQLGDHRGKRLGCKSGALTIGRERDADLGGGRLLGYDAYSAVATQVPLSRSIAASCTHTPGTPSSTRSWEARNRPASAIEKVVSHD